MTTAHHATTVATLAERISPDAQLPLAVLAADVDGQMMCVVIDSFFDESLAPGLVSVRIPANDPAWSALRTAPILGVSVLNPLQTLAAGTFTHTSLPEALHSNIHGAAFVEGSVAQLSTRLYQEFDAGSHTVALLHISSRMTKNTTEPQRLPSTLAA